MRGDDGVEGDKGDEASTGGGLLAVSLQQVVLTTAVNPGISKLRYMFPRCSP